METFNSQEFLERLAAGDFDGHLSEVAQSLTPEQLREVCELLAESERLREKSFQT